jgi:hypothetical protein
MLKKVIVSACVVLFYLTANASAVLSDTTDDGTGTISARGENSSSGEGKAQAFDNSDTTKWLDFSPTGSWIQYQYAFDKRSVVTEYTLTSANDAQERDPKNWNLLGSNDGGATWVTLDTRTNAATWTLRKQKLTFTFTNTTAYNIYRLNITALRGPNPNSVQLAEIELIGTPPTPPVPPAKATSPNPADSAAGVSTTAILSWTAGSGAKSHDVYFGTVLNDVNNAERLLGDLNGNGIVDWNDISRLTEYWLLDPAGTEPYAGVDDDNIVDFFDYALFSQDWMKSANPVFKGNQGANSFNPGTLALNTTYYWRIDEVNGPNTVTGDVWSFTTQSGKAFNPSPVSGVSNVAINATLSWSAGTGATSHNVYFGTTSPGTFRINQAGTTYSPGTLALNTTYYWRIDEVGGFGTIQGDVWSFTTAAVSGNYTLVGKIMCGYQGWFNTPTDGAGRGWVHWGRNNSFTPTTCTVDMWPDMTEYGASEKFLASAFNDGNDHYVFSPYKRDTVLRHFQWMQDYGIDGVYLQRFATEVTPGSAEFNDRNAVLSHCRDGANMYGRKYAVMYDLSGLGAGGTSKVINDWKYLVDTMHISRDPNDHGHMFHNGKPVVALWGFGFGRAYEGQESYNLINFFKNDPVYGGNVVMLGVNDNWRSGASVETRTLLLADIISPWWVGRYGNTSGAYSFASTYGVPDKAWCDTNGKEYLPVMFPGFSWHNLNGGALNQIPRVGGQFLWDQVYADISTIGANMLYLAMFDEVDEGTAIFKVTNDPPRPGSVDMFVTYDIDGYPLPSDEYLWLVGQATRGLRGEIPVNPTRPSRP